MNYSELEQKVIEWADDRGILSKATPTAQAYKTLEEVNELIEAITAQRNEMQTFINSKGHLCFTHEEIKDALGDILVTIIIGAKLQNMSLTDCLESAYNVISKRQGRMISGQFVKDEK